MCHFGIETFQGVLISEKEIQCNVPHRPPTSNAVLLSYESTRKNLVLLPFTVSLDGVRALSSLTYSYVDEIDISSVSPIGGPLEGGGLLVVILSRKYDFDGCVSVICLIGSNVSNGTIISSSSISCPVPSLDEEAVVSVSLVLGGLLVTSSFTYTYQVASSIVAVVPSLGSTAGGTAVIVYGVSFHTHGSMPGVCQCIFGNISVPGLIVNSTAIECKSPASSALIDGLSLFGIILNGLKISSAFSFYFRLVSSLFPVTIIVLLLNLLSCLLATPNFSFCCIMKGASNYYRRVTLSGVFERRESDVHNGGGVFALVESCPLRS